MDFNPNPPRSEFVLVAGLPMRILDLFCCGGGAAMGLSKGFNTIDITGVDINPQPKYPFKFIQADALTFDLTGYDFIWASPPCQAFTRAKHLQGNKHPDLVDAIRQRLIQANVPYCIENVEGAPLINPIMLCGTMFNLQTYRHRLFETNFKVTQPPHLKHTTKQAKMGRPPQKGEFIQVVGNFSGVEFAQIAMGIDWLGQKELSQAIPPAYSEYIGKQYLKSLEPVLTHPPQKEQE
jgi:DNA (cytosine-5)-methyltransferase 1